MVNKLEEREAFQRSRAQQAAALVERFTVLLPGAGKAAWGGGRWLLGTVGHLAGWLTGSRPDFSNDTELVKRSRRICELYSKAAGEVESVAADAAVLQRNVKRGGGLVFERVAWERTINYSTIRGLEEAIEKARATLDDLGAEIGTVVRELSSAKQALDQRRGEVERLKFRNCRPSSGP